MTEGKCDRKITALHLTIRRQALFTDLARYLNEEHQLLDILCAYHESLENIPSWVPTWGKSLANSFIQNNISQKVVTRCSGIPFEPLFSPDGPTPIAKGRLICYKSVHGGCYFRGSPRIQANKGASALSSSLVGGVYTVGTVFVWS